jgi:succinate dehydrogenase hydrophobic membrane anchor protein
MNQELRKGSAYGWLFQRITGIFLAFFLVLHFQVLHFTKDWKIDFNLVAQRLDSTGWVIFYLIFVPAGLFHAFNGAWQVIHDYRPQGGIQKTVKALLWILGIAISVYGYILIFSFSKGA